MMWMCGTIRQANPDTTPRHVPHVFRYDAATRAARFRYGSRHKKISVLFPAPLQSWAVAAPVLFQYKQTTRGLASEYNRHTTDMPSVSARYAKKDAALGRQIALPVPR